jgi:YVTN family beta-propeller protein
MWRAAPALVALVVLVGCGGSSPEPPAYVVARLHVGAQPCAVEGGFGSVWVSLYGDSEELRIDPQTHKVVARIKTGIAPCGVAVGGGSVWVENYGSRSVTRIDPETNEATEIEVGSSPYDVTYAAGAAWVTNYADGTVSRVDAGTGKVRTINVGSQPVGIAPAGGAVWVTDMLDGTISRIDPATLHVRTTKIGPQPAWTSWGSGRLWVSDLLRVEAIDPQTGRRDRSVKLSGQPNDGDVVDGTLWVPDANGRLHGLDVTTGKLRGAWPLGLANPFVLAGWDGLLWVVDFKGTDLVVVDPERLPG